MNSYLIPSPLGYPLLSLLLIIPAAGALVCLALRSDSALKVWGLLVTLAVLALSSPLYGSFDGGTARYQFVEIRRWFPALNLEYVVGVDGISVLLVLLTTFVMPLCLLCSWRSITSRVREFVVVILLMEAAMIGVFISLNTVLFYLFWEGMLIPMYLLIAVWGGPARDYASIKFFLYTFSGSIFLLVAIIALYIGTGTFFMPALMDHGYPFQVQLWVFLGCALSFAVKLPLFPLHTWLPAAHVEAPTAGSLILASILLKMGGYGFLRFCLPMTPAAALACAPYLVLLSLVSIVCGGYLALGQSDMKKLIAYSSVGHMGFVTLGIFMLSGAGIKGAMLQMINHGITTGALFICVGLIYERTHSRELADNSPLGMAMPVYVTFLGLFSLSAFGFPGTSGFVGELLVLIAAFKSWPAAGFVAILGAVLGAAYMLRMLQKMVWGASDGHTRHGSGQGGGGHRLRDANLREFVTLAYLLLFVFWVGLHPGPLLNMMDASVTHLLQQVDAGRHR